MPGQLVIGVSSLSPKLGRMVIVEHKGLEIVKRLSKISPNKLYIVGDNRTSSTDSRDYGWINKSQLIATVVWPKR